MGEISFNYYVKHESLQEHVFKYWFTDTTEYSFAYQRYIALSDASIFNSPVAITKVAAGLSSLYHLFVDKQTHTVIYHNLITKLQDEVSNIRTDYDNTHAIKDGSKIQFVNDILHGAVTNIRNSKLNDILLTILDTKRIHVFDILSVPDASNILRFYTNIYGTSDKKRLKTIDDAMLEKLFSDTLNRYRNLYIQHDKIRMNIYANVSMSMSFNKSISFYKTILVQPMHMKMNILPSFMVSPLTYWKHLNVLQQIITDIKVLQASHLPMYLLKPDKVKIVNAWEQDFAELPITECYTSEIASLSRYDKQGFIYEPFMGYTDDKVSSIFSGHMLGMKRDILQGCTDILISGVLPNKQGMYQEQQSGTKLIKDLYIFMYVHGTLPSKNSMITNIHNVTSENKYLSIANAMDSIYKDDKYMFQTNWFHLKDGTRKTSASDMYSLTKSHKDTFLKENIYLTSNSADIMTLPITWLLKDKKASNTLKNTFVLKTIKNLRLLYAEDFIEKTPMRIHVADNVIGIYGERKSIIITETDNFIYKQCVSIQDTQNDILAYRIKRNMSCFNPVLPFMKPAQEISTYENPGFAIKTTAFIQSLNSLWITWVEKTFYNTDYATQFFVEKSAYDATIFHHGQWVIKSLASVDVPDFDFVLKYELPGGITDILGPSYDADMGMIVPISKVKHQAYINRIDDMVQKLAKDGYISQELSASVLPKHTYTGPIELFCDKQPYQTYIEYKNTSITKSKVHTFINKDEFVKKHPVQTSLFDQIWTEKIAVDSWIGPVTNAQKISVNGFITDDIFTIASNKEIYCHNSIFVDKLDQMCYYDYNMTWAERPQIETQIVQQLYADKTVKMQILDCVSAIVKDRLATFYDFGVFGNTFIRESALFNQIQQAQRKAYNFDILPNDFGNWAWVYETPDPFANDKYGIDELLLPENDTRYEDFKSIIFDEKSMMPRNPVREINETTFVAKYPIKHPLPKYKNVGIDYDKGAIDIDNFYGVETSVMHTIFLKFYRIWQAKIFEFGTMTMVQSVQVMLDTLHEWIMIYFPVEQLEQALRVFRLIRWYGETSIIRNSQYIISYEYDVLNSNLHTGQCSIPNDLDTNNTMFVDATMAVIRNDPAQIGNDAFVTFEIDNKKNTTFTFSLSNTIGSVNIYINDVRVDVVSKSALNLTYDVPYTGESNIIKIEKTASNNLNSTFYIGNIKVPDGSFKDLSIEFDPTLKAGNKPLNEMAQKMISYANMFENREEIYNIMREGNLAIGEIYKRLDEYWKLHHQDKLKGKRLTIKET